MKQALLALLALAACATPAPAPPPTTSAAIHLSGTHWRRVDDEDAMPHPATMAFSSDRASGYTGCNRFFARVTQHGESLAFHDVATTRMACDSAEVAQATERSFLSVLERTRFGHYDRDALVLLDKDQMVIGRFERDD
jgi:heat shock protein HslJ